MLTARDAGQIGMSSWLYTNVILLMLILRVSQSSLPLLLFFGETGVGQD